MRSLKIKFAGVIILLVVAILLVNSLATIMIRRRQLEAEIIASTTSYAQLTVAPLCQGYDLYFTSGYYKFREIVSNLLSMSSHIAQIQILDINGNIRFDSRQLDSGMPSARPDSAMADAALVERIKKLELSVRPVRLPDGRQGLEVVMPYIEEWGRHRLSVKYLASFDALTRQFREIIVQNLMLTLVFVAIGAGLAYITARRITDPISRLTVAAREMGRGQLNQAVAVRSNDEIGELGSNFNQMAQQLKENLEALAQSYEQLSQANMELRQLDQLKSEFIANVSHELRTPLTAISGYAEYLAMGKMGTLSESQSKGLEVMRRNIKRLMRQIKELLDFTTMEAGHLSIEPKMFELRPLLDELSANLQTETEKKRLWLRVEAPDGVRIFADRERVSQVLDNLMMNAIKFTSQGGITLRAEPQPGGGVTFTVADTGIGIPPEAVHRIFERFQQLDGSSTRRYGGVGLGLAIVKSILDSHRSHIEVQSAVGKGTTFTFVLPTEPFEAADHETAPGEDQH